jgi:hypothetical protein
MTKPKAGQQMQEPEVPETPQQIEEPTVKPTSDLTQKQRVAMLEGYVALDAELYGYKYAKKETQIEQNKATASDRKKFSEAGKTISENIEKLIETPTKETAEAITATRKSRANVAKLLKEARKPFAEKAKPLNAAIKYIEKVAKPDALHFLGITVVPQFKVSEEVQAGIEAEAAAKAAA